ncbi:superinfection immunity protein [Microlunatus ginsengisoli]|uniref:Superinfection immunity protein n=1 Tax=Microlunatus ginsengisoli TaxID=363863 RepID=A0ABP6ZHN6_9ACTN
MSGWPDPYVAPGYPQTYVYLPPVHRSSTAHLVVAWLGAVLTAGYLLPWAIGATRNRTNCVATALVNVFLGWTLIGWVVALVMACGSEPQQPVVVRTVPAPYVPPAQPPYPLYPAHPSPGHPPGLHQPVLHQPGLHQPGPGYGSALTPALPAPASMPVRPGAAEVTMPLPAYPDHRADQDDRAAGDRRHLR